MSGDEILTAKELADFLKIAEKTTNKYAAEGKLPGFKIGSVWQFRKSEIDRWITEQEQTQEVHQTGSTRS
jgi:excisionase family DNA binding protein